MEPASETTPFAPACELISEIPGGQRMTGLHVVTYRNRHRPRGGRTR